MARSGKSSVRTGRRRHHHHDDQMRSILVTPRNSLPRAVHRPRR
jgi:hypothetical protein